MEAYFTSPLRRLGLTALSLLLVLALLTASAPAAALAAPLEATCAKNYVVQSGDTLSGIANTYKLTVAELAAANALKEPYTLFIGQQLCIPGTVTTTTSSTTSTSTTSKDKPISIEFGVNTVTVTVSELSKNAGYMVKAMKVERGELDWVKVGKFKADKKGKASATFKLPKRLRDATYLQVCVKNLTDDKVVCARFRRQLSAPIS
jgi:LysM repeat protein